MLACRPHQHRGKCKVTARGAQAEGEEAQALCEELDINVLPTVQFYKDGAKLWEHRGVVQLQQDLGEGATQLHLHINPLWVLPLWYHSPGEWLQSLHGDEGVETPPCGLIVAGRHAGVLYYGDSAANGIRASTFVKDITTKAEYDEFIKAQPDNVLTVVQVGVA